MEYVVFATALYLALGVAITFVLWPQGWVMTTLLWPLFLSQLLK